MRLNKIKTEICNLGIELWIAKSFRFRIPQSKQLTLILSAFEFFANKLNLNYGLQWKIKPNNVDGGL